MPSIELFSWASGDLRDRTLGWALRLKEANIQEEIPGREQGGSNNKAGESGQEERVLGRDSTVPVAGGSQVREADAPCSLLSLLRCNSPEAPVDLN